MKEKSSRRLRPRERKREEKVLKRQQRLKVARIVHQNETQAAQASQSVEKVRRGRRKKAAPMEPHDQPLSKSRTEPEPDCDEKPVAALGLVEQEELQCVELVQEDEDHEARRPVR